MWARVALRTLTGMRVLVAGAGVGGLATARALLAHGHDVRVHERAEQLRRGGGAVTIWSNGRGVLDDLGVDLDDVGRRIDRLEQRRADGSPMYAVDIAKVSSRLGHPTVTIPRRRLLERLAAGLPEGTLAYGQAATDVEEGAGEVRLTLGDGRRVPGDLLVGADGEHSVVRARLVDPAPATPNGWGTWQGLCQVPVELTAGHVGVTVVGKAGYCGLMPAGEGLLYWWFEVRRSPGGPTPADPLEYLRRRFGGWAAPVPDLLAAMTEADLAPFWPHVRHRVPRTWGGGRSTLVGDAAHAMPPSLAQGANQTLEDAWTLGRVLASGADPKPLTDCLRRYERARRRRVAFTSRAAAMATAQNVDHPLQRLAALPTPVITAMYAAMLRGVSTYLADG